uniref:BolA-like protein 1 n=1 Tax=Rhabditophanes sp. KR3021 TaxID=114890 RepID=A0AC35UG58_9BILA
MFRTFYRRMSTNIEEGPMTKLPSHLKVVCESHMHAVPKGSERHFLVECVSDSFENLPKIKCHRLINEVLSSELKTGQIHALRIFAVATSKFDGTLAPEPPKCGGGGHL